MFNFCKGGMLTGDEILRQVEKGNIEIDPFDPSCINPNSYNLKLHPQLLVYNRGSINGRQDVIKNFIDCDLDPIDMNKENETVEFTIGDDGFILKPGILYIGRTVERTFTDKFIPMINGRSSGGRLGISIHVCAGFGDIGFNGTWTLEITVVEPVIIYPNVEIAQVCYFNPCGDTKNLYHGRYNGQNDATASRFYKSKNTDDKKHDFGIRTESIGINGDSFLHTDDGITKID